MDFNKLLEIIKTVATENNYVIEGSDKKFQVYIDKYNAVAFEILDSSNSSGYIEVRQWEYGDKDSSGKYGRSVYSLRNYSNVVDFCSIMTASYKIRARRPTDDLI